MKMKAAVNTMFPRPSAQLKTGWLGAYTETTSRQALQGRYHIDDARAVAHWIKIEIGAKPKGLSDSHAATVSSC